MCGLEGLGKGKRMGWVARCGVCLRAGMLSECIKGIVASSAG